MSNVTKKLSLVISLVSAISLAAVTIHQSGVIKGLKTDLRTTINKLTNTQGLLEKEMALTENLRGEIKVLEDSIEVMHVEVAKLNEKIADQKSTIKYMNQKVKKLEDNVNSFTKQIATLKKKSSTDLAQIQKLEAERNEALKKMEAMDRERAQKMAAAAKAEKRRADEQAKLKAAKAKKEEALRRQRELTAPKPRVERPTPVEPTPRVNESPSIGAEMDAIIKDRVQERMRKVLTSTTVKYSNVEMKLMANGRSLERIKKNGWKYTVITLDMSNPDAEAINDEDFIIQVFDLDNGKVVPVNESNPNFPESSQGSIGYKFTYNGQPVTIEYFNSQKKTGSNYELRIFYSKNNVLLPINNGTMRIVENGVVK